MNEFLLGAAWAFWFGILTAISPCPMATNIAAIAFLARRVSHPFAVLFAGFLYTAGRSAAYVSLAMLLLASVFSAPSVSHCLQKYMNKALGPILIIVGMLLLELISLPIAKSGFGEKLQRYADSAGLWAAFPLGVIFALAFCPVSATLFFASLIPSAVKLGSGLALPMIYGIATALPVLFFSLLLAMGAKMLGQTYNRLVSFEKWARWITGGIFIAVGIYYCLANIFGVFA